MSKEPRHHQDDDDLDRDPADREGDETEEGAEGTHKGPRASRHQGSSREEDKKKRKNPEAPRPQAGTRQGGQSGGSGGSRRTGSSRGSG